MRYFLSLLFFCQLAWADEPPKSSEKESKKAEETQSRTINGKVTIAGQEISYQAKAASLTLKDDEGKDRANIFHVAYTIPPETDEPSRRPVTFCFNGGPGSSAVWLHLGGIGPRLVPTTPDGTMPVAPPVVLKENPHSILDVTDLVFIDPVSTGFSRASDPKKKGQFHGLEGDISSVSDFIRRWTTENKRWSSPKFLLGESYGGIRAAGLSKHLQDNYGMNLNGVVMLSSLLDFRTLRPSAGDDYTHAVFLPGFTATAHHHGKIEGDRNELFEEARAFAFGPYYQALLQGIDLPAEKKTEIASQLAAFTGLPADFWEKNDLRISASKFRKHLLEDQKKVLGRFDARVAWPTIDPNTQNPSYDPSYSIVYGAFATAMKDYLSQDFEWETTDTYEILTGKVHPWKWGRENSIVNLSGRLRDAMVDNPHLQVLVMCGYTDLATPPSGILQTLRTLRPFPEPLRENITTTWYDAGHMFYLNQPDLEKMRTDLVSFIQKAVPER